MGNDRDHRKVRVLAAFMLIVGLLLCFDGWRRITSDSVTVSGYFRSDGTYVSPYKRRPPYSTSGDSPSETERTFGLFLTLIGGWTLWSTRNPPIPFRPSTAFPPKTEPVPLVIPTLRERPNAGTRCASCGCTLNCAEDHFYYLSEEEKVFLCDDCRDEQIRLRRAIVRRQEAS
jgi:hypothetical protein